MTALGGEKGTKNRKQVTADDVPREKLSLNKKYWFSRELNKKQKEHKKLLSLLSQHAVLCPQQHPEVQ